MKDIKPVWPPCSGLQHDHDAGNSYLEVHYGEFGNEIAEDRPMQENATPGVGSFNYSAKYYHSDFPGGYGTDVDAGGVSRENMGVNAQSTERGKEN